MAHRRGLLTVGSSIAGMLLVGATLSTRSAAQGPELANRYFSSFARAHRVTVSRNGNVVAGFDIPIGVYLSVYSDRPPVRTAQEGRVEFHGNVEIRTLPRADVDRPGPGDAEQMMARAPLVVAAQNVDVVSETIIP